MNSIKLLPKTTLRKTSLKPIEKIHSRIGSGFPVPMSEGVKASMPSVSKKQQIATAIAEHDPGKLYARNQGLLRMSHQQLHEFAATPRKELPEQTSRRRHKVSY